MSKHLPRFLARTPIRMALAPYHLERRLAGGLPFRGAVPVAEGRLLIKTTFNHRMLLDGSDLSLTPQLAVAGCWQLGTALALRRLLRRGDVTVDAGAHMGYFALIAAGCVGGDGRVFAFEPNPRMAELCRLNAALNHYSDTLRVEELALSDVECEVLLHIPEASSGSACIHGPPPEATARAENCRTVAVPTVRLDQALLDQRRIGLLRLDAEGSEPAILRGLGKRFDEDLPRLILEFSPELIEHAGEDPSAFLGWLRTHGYELKRIDDAGFLHATGDAQLLGAGHLDIVGLPPARR